MTIIWDYDDPRWATDCVCGPCGARLDNGLTPCPECGAQPPSPRSVDDDDAVPPPPTRAQVDFLRSLIERKATTLTAVGLAESGLWSRSGVSDAITALKGLADLPRERVNRFAGKCGECGQVVDAEAGLLTGGPGRWGAQHRVCPEGAPVAPATVDLQDDPPEGIHLLDGVIYKVQEARTSSGRLYAKVLHPEDGGDRWHYNGQRAPFYDLSDETLISLEEAAKFGHLYGICCNCGRDLTDEVSIERGIGPVCYGRLTR